MGQISERRSLLAVPLAPFALVGLIAASPAPATRPADPPRYRLSVGQQLNYADRTAVVFDGQTLPTVATVAFRVVGRTADQLGWHLVGTVSPAHDSIQVFRFDLWPDGRLGPDGTDAPAEATKFFPPLPPATTTDQWDGPADDSDIKEAFRPAPTTRPASFGFVAELSENSRIITGAAIARDQVRRGTLDTNAGVLVHAEREDHRGLGHLRTIETEKLDLTSTTLRPADGEARYAVEVEAYLSALNTYAMATYDARQANDREAAMIRAMEPLLTLQRSGQLVDATLRTALDQEITDGRQAIAKAVGILNRPAPAWDLVDLNGRRHTLAEQRGKVIVLDFWFRACPPCVAAMPDLQRMADHYGAQPVAFFGMNIDRDAKDAQAIVDRCKVTYPTLRLALGGEAVLKAYLVAGCPTFVIIGPDGVVRHVHVGFGPTLHDDMAKEIDALLPKGK